jgi:hypothetical protein
VIAMSALSEMTYKPEARRPDNLRIRAMTLRASGDVGCAASTAIARKCRAAHEVDMARKLERLHKRQTQQLLRAMQKSMA